MAPKRGATTLTEAELLHRVTVAVGNGFTQRDVRDVVRALKDEMIAALQDGEKVTLSGLVSIVPSAKAGRKKGAVIRNPFDGSERRLTKDEPDKFVVKARVSTAVKNGFPTARTTKGQQLLTQLKPPVKKGKR